MKMLYFPGGPGMNAYPESQLLTKPYADTGIELVYWNEPSVLRPDGDTYSATNTFQNSLDSAERFFLKHYEGAPLPVFAFCWGGQPLSYLLKKHPEKISKVLIVTPDYCFKEANSNMFSFTASDYRKHGFEAEARRLEEIIRHNSTEEFTPLVEEGFHLFAQNPRVFDYYWTNKEAMNRYMVHYNANGYQLDFDGFFDCRRSRFDIELEASPVPAVVVLGKYDRIISVPDELDNIKRMFKNFTILEMECDHYPHIELLEEFLAIVVREFQFVEAHEV
ncbi:hypothetical protein GCM10027592_56170 [Spirosoma flavus]